MMQSRVGPVEWLKPYTDETIIELGMKGVKSILAVPISFVSEHIETLEEIDVEYKELALESGIQNWARVPALGVEPTFISDLADAVIESLPYVGAMAVSNLEARQSQFLEGSVREMNSENNFSQIAPPGFDGENYHLWAVRMETYLEALDLWEAVEEDDDVLSLPDNPTAQEQRRLMRQDGMVEEALTTNHKAQRKENKKVRIRNGDYIQAKGKGNVAIKQFQSLVPLGSVEELLAAYDSQRRELPPPVTVWEWGWTKSAETWNGRAAMLAVLVLLVLEVTTGEGFLHQWGILPLSR
ncbi:Ferrochelatase-2, chloroplastic [Capsicum annuum]|nr:Ferrochelatase-2, chloroplastic [Capsicum annuum]KAF3654181.1 Ferrochelatase-2, chloroplastic [Capsicum annuum]